MKFVIAVIAASLMIGPAGQVQASDRETTILVIGDSLSAGFGIEPRYSWVALLQDRLRNQGYGYRIVNASISGDTTAGGLRRLPRALQLHQPVLVIIELGGNDGLRGLPPSLIRQNLAAMIRLSQRSGADVILAGMKIPPNYGQSYTAHFSDLYAELAEEFHVLLITFLLDQVALNPDLMQADGIHPNARGQQQLLDNVWEVLEPVLVRNPAAIPDVD